MSDYWEKALTGSVIGTDVLDDRLQERHVQGSFCSIFYIAAEVLHLLSLTYYPSVAMKPIGKRITA
ncbi:hypothetical protein SISSUDRAFT_1066998 [Sistotremastrum suecicum HHB10207 ss-3]|uniref:Uncharacterized protein n=1 Tax=Sistotremastrum suecicum HHB10207 ss-3 TaxID=1314776 RepID=A0A165XMI3_9AGAM|nr:hypothetical protein SISSUDRAFT_1066998 [Sistotremastrum suecicum HHB10207 ss-3]